MAVGPVHCPTVPPVQARRSTAWVWTVGVPPSEGVGSALSLVNRRPERQKGDRA